MQFKRFPGVTLWALFTNFLTPVLTREFCNPLDNWLESISPTNHPADYKIRGLTQELKSWWISLIEIWSLHYDNVRLRLYVIISVQQYLGKCNIKIISHHPYSLDLAPCDWDFWLFSTSKEELRGKKFITDSEVILTVQGSLKQLPEKGFFVCFEKWIERVTVPYYLREDILKKKDLFYLFIYLLCCK